MVRAESGVDSERSEKDVLTSGVKRLGSRGDRNANWKMRRGPGTISLTYIQHFSVYPMLSSTVSHLSITTLYRVDKER